MSSDDLRTLMRTAVADAPEHDLALDRVAGLARARTQRRRLWYSVAGVGAAAATVGVVALGSGVGAFGGTAPAPLAGAPSPAPSSSAPLAPVDPGAISLPTSLPLGEAVAVVGDALPSGFTVGELGPDVSWSPSGGLELPISTPAGPATLTLSAGADGCGATTSADIPSSVLEGIADGICAAKSAYPQEPGTVVDGGPVDPAA